MCSLTEKGDISMEKYKVIKGPYKGKVGVLIGVYWASDFCTLKLGNGEEIGVPLALAKKIES